MIEEKLRIAKANNKVVFKSSYVMTDDVTIPMFEKYIELIDNVQIQTLFNSIMDYDSKIALGIRKVLSSQSAETAFKKIANKFGRIDESTGEEVLELFAEDDFIKFVNMVNDDKFDRNIKTYELKSKYKTKVIYKNWDSSVELLNDFIRDGSTHLYNIEDMKDYYKLRDEYFERVINEGDMPVSRFVKSYFGVFLNEIDEIARKADRLNIKGSEEFNIFRHINDVQTKEELLKYLELAKSNKNVFQDMKHQIKEESKKDISKNVNTLILPGDKKIIELSGQDFTMLIHRIKGLLNGDITDKLESDISNWYKNFEEDSYISCSLINQLFLGFTCGDHLTMGFKNISKEDIIAMSTGDMCFLKRDIKGNTIDHISKFMSAEQLFDSSNSGYNEVVLKRYREKEAIMPDYLVSFDKIDDQTKDASDHFNIPIYVLLLEKYAELYIRKLDQLKKQNPEQYIASLRKLKGCMNCAYNNLKDYYGLILESEALKSDNEEANMIANEMMRKIRR